jgi:hypothetical protein
MKLSIDSELVVQGVQMDALRLPLLVQALGSDRTEEKIPLHGGGTRRRETWGVTGVTTLRDEEEEAICLIVDASRFEVSIGGRELPNTEREFLRSFASAEKQIGHSYSLRVKQWLLYFDFPPNRKRRGVGSSVRQLSRVTISRNKKGQPVGIDNDRAARSGV